jgi:hypothetical protein
MNTGRTSTTREEKHMVWKRKESSKDRRERAAAEAKVLVGFGKHDLKDLVADEDGEETLIYALTKHHWPPRYRRESICSEDEIDAFKAYMIWLQRKLKLTNRRAK